VSKAKKKTTKKANFIDPLTTSGVSARTLEDTPGRAVSFLRGIGTTPAIRIVMRARGYTLADHVEGWRLVQAASGFIAGEDEEVLSDAEVTAAIAELNGIDEDLFRIVRSAARKHADAVAFIVAGIAPVDGPDAVLGVETILARLRALESGSERKATRKADAKALATLAERGLDGDERKRLAALVATAKTLHEDSIPDADAEAQMQAEHVAALDELRAWFDEWTEVARASVKRRDHLIRIGLAERRVSTKAEPAPEPVSP
jgi:hypothetical protein